MKKYNYVLIGLAAIAFVGSAVLKLGGFDVGVIFPSTLRNLANSLLLFSIAISLLK